MNNRIRFFAAVCVVTLSLPIFAASLWSSSNASLNDPTHEVSEPTTIVHSWGGSDWYVSAYIQSQHPNSSATQHLIYASYNQNLIGRWTPQPLGLYNPYDPPLHAFTQSSDPVLVRNESNVSMHVIGVLYSGDASNATNVCSTDNEIGLWTSYNGGQSWSYPVRIYRNASTGRFTDKPAALVSKYGMRAGTVFIAFNDSLTCGSGNASIIRFFSFDPNTSIATQLGVPLQGAAFTNPVIYEDPATGTLYLSAMDFGSSPAGIVFRTSYDGGASWVDPGAGGTISDAGLLRPGSDICSDGNAQCAGASLGMTGKFDPVYGSLVIVYHRRKGTSGAEVMFTRGLPGRWFTPQNISTNAADYTWTPALALDSSGNAIVTYYDYDHGNSPSTLRYVVKSAQIAAGTMVASGETTLFDTTQYSYPVPTYQIKDSFGNVHNEAALGEYQDVVFWNSNFYAVTVYIENSVGDIYHLRILP